jgi:gliding motility-associated-like protein
MALMKQLIFIITLFSTLLLRSQIANNNCFAAGQLCPNDWVDVNNLNSTSQTCLSCQDDFDLCFTPLNTSWITFNTYESGGDMLLDIRNVQFEASVNNNNNSINLAIFKAAVPCVSQSYELIHCVLQMNNSINEIVTNLEPNAKYYIVFSGSQVGGGALEPSQASFQIRIGGDAVNRPTTNVTIGAVESQICLGAPLTLLADLTNCPEASQIDWYKNGVFWLTTPTNGITTNEVENGDQFGAQTTCYQDCPMARTSNTVTITVHDFQVDAGADLTISQGQGVMLSGSTDQSNFFWAPPTGLNNPNILNPIASPDVTTTFYLTASNGICEIVDEMTVYVISELVVPDVFTPNGDGINDTWQILGTENFQEVYVTVYDRSGQRVFEAVNYNPLKFWNGSFKGRSLPSSTYFYVIQLDRSLNTNQTLKGSVTIIR